MFKTITISQKGQITIPKEIRQRFNIMRGTKIFLSEDNDKLILELKNNKQEKEEWQFLAEKNMSKIWDNSQDEKIWAKYLTK
ncbi:AbrB/MazE/SpoVT family DNA-binding domain-containing protein [Candidatus Parcubacteria bacterium]|nr:AbrB/MazE/SpoVT family DNA-binding domain-containing protein [Candidatus Parcubacteria bacterium]